MKSLMKYMREYRKECVLGPLFKLLEATLELLVPLVVAAIIDNGIKSGDTPYILWMCVLMVGLGLVGLVSSITAQYFAAKAAVGFSSKLRHALFSHIQSLSYSELDTIGTSTLMTRMTSDVNQVQNGVNLTLRLLLRSPFVVFGAMVMAFTIDLKAALIFAVAIPVLFAVVAGIMALTMPLYKKVQKKLDHVLGITRENLTGVRVVRAFDREEAETVRFEGENGALTGLQLRVGRISVLMNPLTYVVINLGIVLILRRGSSGVNVGELTQGQVVALVNYMSQILVELIKLANLVITISKSLACAGRISAVLAQPSSMSEPEAPQMGSIAPDVPVVTFSHVGFTYQGAGAKSLDAIDFTVKRGETVGVIGGTGSGKSSLVNLIPRFYDASEGSVSVDGVDVKQYAVKDLRQKIGIVPQKAALFSGTIRGNLLWGNENADDAALWQALEAAQAAEFVRKKGGGLDARVEQNGRNFSGGQKQRLTIARALVRKPEILILDDSASALDFATDAALRKAIRELPDAPTTFIVSQRASSIRYADQILVLDDGRAVGCGRHEQLMESCPVYREIYQSQFETKGGDKQ